MRGRLLLAGTNPDSLSLIDWVDVAEAAWVEPYAHGSRLSVDEHVDELANAIERAYPDPKTWGSSPEAIAGMQSMEQMWGGPAPAAYNPPKKDKPATPGTVPIPPIVAPNDDRR